MFPCKWEAGAAPDIASTFSPTYNITPSSSPSGPSTSGSGSGGSSNTGAIAGGVIGGIGALAIFAALVYFCWYRPKRRQHYITDGKLEKSEISAPSPENPSQAEDEPHLNKAELANTQRHELEGSVGPSKGPAVFEMPAREEVATELRATNNDAQELLTPETTSDAPQSPQQGEFPWRKRVSDGEANSPSPLGSPGSPGSGMEGMVSPVSSPGLPSPIPSPTNIPSSVPSPLPSPPPIVQPQPQKAIRADLITADSSQVS